MNSNHLIFYRLNYWKLWLSSLGCSLRTDKTAKKRNPDRKVWYKSNSDPMALSENVQVQKPSAIPDKILGEIPQ